VFKGCKKDIYTTGILIIGAKKVRILENTIFFHNAGGIMIKLDEDSSEDIFIRKNSIFECKVAGIYC
jgi:hypothetical protein